MPGEEPAMFSIWAPRRVDQEGSIQREAKRRDMRFSADGRPWWSAGVPALTVMRIGWCTSLTCRANSCCLTGIGLQPLQLCWSVTWWGSCRAHHLSL